MEFVSSSLLHKYEAIINKINHEYEKSQQLKDKLNQENNSIIVCNILKNKLLDKLSHVDVKIFNSVIELLNLYEDELDQDIPYEFCKYYLVEIYITKQLLEKLCKSDWIFIISVRSNTFYISKSINLPKKSVKIVEVIPVIDSIMECTVEAYLVNTKTNNLLIKLGSIEIDISYHFYKYKKQYNRNLNIVRLTKLYNKNNETFFLRTPPLEYQLTVPLDKQKFIEYFLCNSYNNLDIELFADLQNSENKKDFTIQIGAKLDKIEVVYNRRDKVIIKAQLSDLEKIKKYFLKMFNQENGIPKKVIGVMEVKNASVLNLDDAILLYKNMRKLSSTLPI